MKIDLIFKILKKTTDKHFKGENRNFPYQDQNQFKSNLSVADNDRQPCKKISSNKDSCIGLLETLKEKENFYSKIRQVKARFYFTEKHSDGKAARIYGEIR